MQPAPIVPPAHARHAWLLVRQPWWTLALLLLAAAGWSFLAWIALDMESAAAQWMMPASSDWSVGVALAVWGMWAVMMAAMMLPSAWPMVLTFVALGRRSGKHSHAVAFVAAYLFVWSAFSLLATALQWGAQVLGWTNPMAASRSAVLTGALLLAAGAYQFTRLKDLCLQTCRSPVGFLFTEWRSGARGAFVMGARHGLLCVGCCWALMLLLFVGGIMNLPWIAALAAAVALEKLAPRARLLARMMGLLLLAAGATKLLALPM
ncbi:MAG TPA: DUF2182 domain-containing protein [Ramlibacter sp.]|uniref:DUF2182 domain-containing protein n=1 Tax=Ramlibacter sp. TaxID=1917967 RepID=UPI002D7E8142|nr:DUF2182 domain-containing protein [Ramlibacter sp.]HET8747149.1 DUF2182 domain-containing protein [Ramlibacter sp.]